jgi:putative endonuclease
MEYTIYMLECSNGAYYTGYTTDLLRRYQEHCEGTAKCKYTRSFPPVRIAASWDIEAELGVVLRLERLIKKMTPRAKRGLVLEPDQFWTSLFTLI